MTMSYAVVPKDKMLEVLRKNRKTLLDKSTTWSRILSVLKLEEQFGKILYLPLDVEPIFDEHEQQAFKEWFFDQCKPIKKYNPDVGLQWKTGSFPYDAVSTPKLTDSTYEQNPIDINKIFPNIAKKLKQLPFKDIPEYRIWSSRVEIPVHRDAFYPLDIPSSFRFVLFDENPESTFWLQEHSKESEGEKFFIPKNSCFAWNNTRLVHGSSFYPSYRKALLIPAPVKFDLITFKKLVIRSIKKYESQIVFSDKNINDFI